MDVPAIFRAFQETGILEEIFVLTKLKRGNI